MAWIRFTLALSALALVATSAPAQPAKTSPPSADLAKAAASEAELEYWRSVQRIDTPAAYRSYLDSFPNGLFANLARLKLALPAAPAAPAKAPEVPVSQAAGSASLRSFSEPLVDSGAVAFNLGDRLNGPGLMMVGSVGAKKQLLLPPGEWVLLAATDSKSVQGTIPYAREYPIGLTTLVFGRFAGTRVSSLLRYTSNRQVAYVSAWTDLEACDRSAGGAGIAYAKLRNGLRDECSALRVEDDAADKLLATSPETKASLARLGASVRGAGLVSTLTFGDSRLGYLGITRIDWPGTALGPAADRASAWRVPAIESAAAHQRYLKRLGDWAQAYRTLATEGFKRSFETSDLVANVPARPSPELSGLADFDAAAPAAGN